MTNETPANAQSSSHYRYMHLQDVKRVFCIDEEVYIFPWSEGIFADCIKTGHLCIVNEIDNKIIAYGVIGMVINEAHILNLSVCKEFQSQGYGRELLLYLLAMLKRGNVVRALLEVRESNEIALNLYKSLDFEKIGLRKDYYPLDNGRENAVVLSKHIQ